MTDAQILAIAYGFEQYPGAKEPTLRGQAIVDFARALLSEESANEMRALRASDSFDIKRSAVDLETRSGDLPAEVVRTASEGQPSRSTNLAEAQRYGTISERAEQGLNAGWWGRQEKALRFIHQAAVAAPGMTVGELGRMMASIAKSAEAALAPEVKPRVDFAAHYTPPGTTSSAAAPKEIAS